MGQPFPSNPSLSLSETESDENLDSIQDIPKLLKLRTFCLKIQSLSSLENPSIFMDLGK